MMMIEGRRGQRIEAQLDVAGLLSSLTKWFWSDDEIGKVARKAVYYHLIRANCRDNQWFGSTVPLMENNKSESKSHRSFPFNGHHCMNWGSLLLSLVLCVSRAFAGALAGDLIAHY